MPTTEQTFEFIRSNPGLRAREIAAHFQVETTGINQILYGPLTGRVIRDPDYRWSVTGHHPIPPPPPAVQAQRRDQPRRPPVAQAHVAGQHQPLPLPAAAPAVLDEMLSSKKPRQIIVAASSRLRYAKVYEGAAVPRGALDALASGGLLKEGARRALSQCLAEWPVTTDPVAEADMPSWLAVTGKLLRRGSIIPLDPRVEERLRPMFGDPSDVPEDWTKAASEILTVPFEHTLPDPDTYDSPEERRFFEDLLPGLEPSSLLRFWQRQASIGSLTGHGQDFQANQRVDFLFSYPDTPPLVVEIDGEQHANQRNQDAARDARLGAAGVDVLRIPTNEIATGTGLALTKLRERLSTLPTENAVPLSNSARWLIAGRRIQQIQLLLVEAFEKGLIPRGNGHNIRIHFQHGLLSEVSFAAQIGSIALDDFNNLTGDVAAAQGLPSPPTLTPGNLADSSLFLSFAGETLLGDKPALSVQDAYFPSPSELDVPTTRPFRAQSVDPEACKRLLHRVFGFTKFHEGQFEAIERTLLGQDSLVLLPTGSGKSIAFQLAAFLRPGVAIVVDPIVSLIEDQLENLRAHGIDRAERIVGTQPTEEQDSVMALLARTQYWFCYVAPERFQVVRFRNYLRALTTNSPVALVAVDEAHCVSEWGHDFRTAYLNLAKTARMFCATGNVPPPIMGLTGTASRSVLKDIQRELDITDFNSVIVPKSFDRPELSFGAFSCHSSEKQFQLRALLDRMPALFGEPRPVFFSNRNTDTRSGLLFCPHVGGDHGVVRVGKIATEHINRDVPVYGSTAPQGIDHAMWARTLREAAVGFRRNRFALMACTKAYGMGIDKPNVRYTIHYNLPSSVESFYQEAGRSGRDGHRAYCFIIFSNDYRDRNAILLNPATPTAVLHRRVEEAGWNNADDITRAFFFLNNAFQGIEREEQVLGRVVQALGPLDAQRRTTIPFHAHGLGNGADGAKNQTEKALHRLVLTGAIADYTIDWSHHVFQVEISGAGQDRILEHLYRYVATYQRQRGAKALEEAREYLDRPYNDFILAVAHQITKFVYDVVERGRRQALAEMLRICEKATDGEDIRQPILDYLGRSKYAERIDAIIQGSENAGVDDVASIVQSVSSVMDAAELLGECARLLEAYPDQPSLRLLRAAAEAMTPHPDEKIVMQNVESAIRDGISNYGLSLAKILDVVVISADVISESRPEIGKLFLQAAALAAPDRRLAARYLLQQVGEVRHHLLGPPLALVIWSLVESVQQMREG